MAAQDYYSVVQELYVAYFGRPADHYGLLNYAAQLDALNAPTDFSELNAAAQADKGGKLAALVNTFSGSDESKALYGTVDVKSDQSVGAFVLGIYKNLLGRSPDADGFNFWVDAIKSGGLTPAYAAAAIADATQTNTTPQGLKDAAMIQNKVAVAGNFTEALSTPDLWVAFSGEAAAQAARNLIGNVTDTTNVTTYQDTVTKAVGELGNVPAKTFTLTTGIDAGAAFTGGNGADVFNATIDNTSGAGGHNNDTLTPLDVLTGGAGNDTLALTILNNAAGTLPSVTTSSIENVTIRAAQDLAADLSTWADVTNVTLTQGAGVDLSVGDSTALNISGATGGTGHLVKATGGASQSIKASGAAVTSVGAKGDVSITADKAAAYLVSVNGGANVNATVTGATAATHAVTVGASAVPTGAVNVNLTGAAYDKAASSTALGDIVIKGGTSVTVNEVAYASTADAAGDTTSVSTLTQGAVSVEGNQTVTSVTVNQSKAVTADTAVTAVAGVKEAYSFTVGALNAGQQLTVGGLTFTAAKNLTAAEVAAAFSNVAAGAFQGHGAVANGTYTGAFSAQWTAAASNGSTITLVAKDAAANLGAPTLTTNGSTAPAATGSNVAGVANVDAKTGVAGIANGVVTITDTGSSDKIATVTLNGYAGGSTVASDALTKLSLANSSGSLTVTNAAAKTLDLTVDALKSGASVVTPTYENVNLHVASDSTFTLTSSSVKALVVDGTGSADVSGSGVFSTLTTLTVKGSAGLNIGANSAGANVTAIDTTGTTGAVTASIDSSKATFAGGAGADTVTVTSASVQKSLSTGAGNDTVTLKTGTNIPTVVIDGGDGTDTLGLAAADAASLSSTSTFATKFTNFEKLSLGNLASGTATVDLANLNNIAYVVSANGAVSNTSSNEVQTFTVTHDATAAGNITVAGVNVAVGATDNIDTIGNAIANASYAGVSNIASVTYDSGTDTVTVTYNSGVDESAISLGAASTGVTFGTPFEATKGGVVTAAPSVTLKNYAANGTLELTQGGAGAIVQLKDATGTADNFNIVTKLVGANVSYGTVDVAGVETVSLNVNDTDTSTTNGTGNGVNVASLTVKDAALKTLTITGNANLNLTVHSSDVNLTSIDGSAATGKLNIGTNASANAAATVLGSAQDDSLTANHNSDVLQGGAGNDYLSIHAGVNLATLTGGAGNDTFDVSNASGNVNGYATITDLGSGDVIQFANTSATETFTSAKLALGDTAVFQDYANEAIHATSQGAISWFQFGGNTYVVENVAHGTSFTNGQDIIVKITGNVDLSTASFSADHQTLLVG